MNVQPTSYNHNLCAEFGFEEMGCRGASAMRKLCAIYAHSHATTTTGRPAARRRQTRNWTRPGPASTDNRQAPGDTGTPAPAKPTQQQQQQQKQTGKAEAETHPPKKQKSVAVGAAASSAARRGRGLTFYRGDHDSYRGARHESWRVERRKVAAHSKRFLMIYIHICNDFNTFQRDLHI